MFAPEVFPVTNSIWCVRRRSYLTCSYIVTVADGTVLIDAGMDSDGQDMLDGLKQIGQPVESVQAILLTHWHNDHAAGGRVLQIQSGAPVYYHRADAPFLTRETAHGGLRGWLSDVIPEWGFFVLFKGLLGEASPQSIAAAAWVEDGETLLGDFEVIATPGHTDGHVAYYYRPARALFAGDALAVVNNHIHFMARPVTPDVHRARASMLRCLSLDIDILCPGHRAPLTNGVGTDVGRQCREMRDYIGNGGHWPLLG